MYYTLRLVSFIYCVTVDLKDDETALEDESALIHQVHKFLMEQGLINFGVLENEPIEEVPGTVVTMTLDPLMQLKNLLPDICSPSPFSSMSQKCVGPNLKIIVERGAIENLVNKINR